MDAAVISAVQNFFSMKNLPFALAISLFLFFEKATAQTNLFVTNPTAEKVLLGNFDPADFAPAVVVSGPGEIISAIQSGISPDSLKNYIIKLATFKNRNTGADTVSNLTGIGAARRWVHQKFAGFGAASGGRLLPTYFQFDQAICGAGRHRNILAVLPGSDAADHGIILLEAHIDSRCETECDINCPAEGIEDNASGTALVIELARVMSQFSFKNTIVFAVVIGEEQGLLGANAIAEYMKQKGLPLRAVWNNDVVGGIACGKTASPPGCMTVNAIDSLNVRIFSQGGTLTTSANKQLARFTKLEFEEELFPLQPVKMAVKIMSPEDRTGRGGDHIPFRQKGFSAIRFTAANEHGDASNGAGYTDRQHTSEDILGIDTDQNGEIDSFFVDFNYLARNAAINATAASMAAIGVKTPTSFTAEKNGDQLFVSLTDPVGYGKYRVMLRNITNLFDTVYTMDATAGQFTMPGNLSGTYRFVSVASVDADGVESIFTLEKNATPISGTVEPIAEEESPVELYQNRPNPFDAATYISFLIKKPMSARSSFIQITHPVTGEILEKIPVEIREGLHEVLYEHGHMARGAFLYSLIADGQVLATRTMVFAY